MSDNIPKIEVLMQLRAMSYETAKRAWTALLAEHRAEVERLSETCAERFRLAEEQEGRAARAEARLSSARDAALEEAAAFIEGDACNPRLLPQRIRALKSRPAKRHLPESKVREALVDAMFHSLWTDGSGLTDEEKRHNDAVREVAENLGINIDAKAECVGCIPGHGVVPDGHVAAANPLCPVHGDKGE